MKRTVTIGGNGVYTERLPGYCKVFAVYSATGTVDVELDQDGKIPVQPGQKIKEGTFRRLRITDTSGAENTVSFYAGTADVEISLPSSAAGTATQVALVRDAVTPTEGVVLVAVTGTIQQLAAGSTAYFTELVIYPAKGVSSGVLTANTGGNIYIGRSGTYLPDLRAPEDVSYPVVYTAPQGKKIPLSAIRIKGTAGDGVFYSYIAA